MHLQYGSQSTEIDEFCVLNLIFDKRRFCIFVDFVAQKERTKDLIHRQVTLS